ncbi:FAD-dependent oxidoreductase [bacterium]|nr:MAG: FAD-dependent oxidoreductase [bacterium]
MTNKQEARIKEIIPRTYNVKSFRLEVSPRNDFKAGQFLSVALGEGPQLKRYLSVSSSPTEEGYIEFTKKITESQFSRTLNSLKPNDKVIIEYPFGNFILQETDKKIAFLSGGIGITPIRSICKYVVDKKPDIGVVLLYANRTSKDIAFKDDFALFQKVFPGLKVVHLLAEADPACAARIGRIDKTMVQEEIPDYNVRRFYLCGPPQMVEAMQKILSSDLIVAKEAIITENFKGY